MPSLGGVAGFDGQIGRWFLGAFHEQGHALGYVTRDLDGQAWYWAGRASPWQGLECRGSGISGQGALDSHAGFPAHDGLGGLHGHPAGSVGPGLGADIVPSARASLGWCVGVTGQAGRAGGAQGLGLGLGSLQDGGIPGVVCGAASGSVRGVGP